jgi:hypothetical protein
MVFLVTSGGSKSCVNQPCGSECDNCGYYEEREVTKHFKRKYDCIVNMYKEVK